MQLSCCSFTVSVRARSLDRSLITYKKQKLTLACSHRRTVASLRPDLLQSWSSEAAVAYSARDRHAFEQPCSPWFNLHRPSCSPAIPLRSPAIKPCHLRRRVGSPEMAGQKGRTICAFLLVVSVSSAPTARGPNLAYGPGRTSTRPMFARKRGRARRRMHSQGDGSISSAIGEEKLLIVTMRTIKK